MADITLSYKGSTIAAMNASGSKTIQTKEKYCEDDISMVYNRPILSGTAEPTAAQGENGDVYLQYEPAVNIPAEYQRLTYLEANGYQSIDTGVDFSSTSYFKVKGAFTQQDVPGASNNTMFGIGYSLKESDIQVYQRMIYNQIGANYVAVTYNNKIHIYEGNQDAVLIDNNNASPAWSNVPAGERIRLFSILYYGSGMLPSYARIYDCKIYSGSTLIRHFIPVKRLADDVLGMYDAVNDTFTVNDKSGDFIAGSIWQPGTNIKKSYVKMNGVWSEI